MTRQDSPRQMLRTDRLAARRFELMAAEYLQRMGARMRERREELGLSQEDVARKLPGKTNGNQVSRWERGLHRPGDDTMEALAKILDVDVAFFLAQAPDKTETPDLVGTMDVGVSQLDRIEAKLNALLRFFATDPDEHARARYADAILLIPANARPDQP